MKLILSLSHLRHNSEGAKPFSGGGQNAPFAPSQKNPCLQLQLTSQYITTIYVKSRKGENFVVAQSEFLIVLHKITTTSCSCILHGYTLLVSFNIFFRKYVAGIKDTGLVQLQLHVKINKACWRQGFGLLNSLDPTHGRQK